MSALKFAESLARELKHMTAITVKDEPLIRRAKNKIINDFLVQVIFRDWAKQNSIRVHKDGESGWQTEVDLIRSGYPDEISFRKALADEGLTYKEWTSKIRFSVLQKLVINGLHKDIKEPTKNDVKSYFKAHQEEFIQPEAIKVEQVVLRTEAEAERISKELRARKPMDQLAKKFSITPDAVNGGKIGWVEKGTSAFFDKAFKTSVGRRTNIIKSPYGFHIIKVLKKRSRRSLRLNEVTDQIKKILIEKREQAVYTAWLEEQLKRARVFKNNKAIDAINVATRG